MADVRPFKAYRPAKGRENEIAALPYDVYNREEATAEVSKHPHSFLAIDRAETGFDTSVDTYAPEVYARANQLLQDWIAEGSFVQDREPSYYLYELTMDGRSQTGIVAAASIDDYQNGIIRKHENTREDKELDRIRHVDTCSMQTGPIFLAYRQTADLKALVSQVKAGAADADFTSEDGIRHRTWSVAEPALVSAFEEGLKALPRVYIADGHHRCASAVKVGMKRRAEHPSYTGEEEFNYFLSVLFPDEELAILDYNRVVKDLGGLSVDAFLARVAESFTVETVGKDAYHPEKKGTFGMFLNDTWYRLTAKAEIMSTDAVEGLDVSVLQNHLLGPILGIGDPRVDKRIDFVGGIRGLSELERRVHTDMQVAFSMYPTSIAELFAVADAGRLMPPKSTWFEPKLRSGLFLHEMER